MSDIKYFSQEGLDKLKAELHHLKTKGRSEMSKAIAEAREKGDLSENSEYDAAKEAQGYLELKINQLEGDLANARVLDDSEMDNSRVYILSKVKVKNLKMNKEFNFTVVSPNEADLKTGKISVESPIGEALLGAEVGEIVKATVPAGVLELEILEISR